MRWWLEGFEFKVEVILKKIVEHFEFSLLSMPHSLPYAIIIFLIKTNKNPKKKNYWDKFYGWMFSRQKKYIKDGNL